MLCDMQTFLHRPKSAAYSAAGQQEKNKPILELIMHERGQNLLHPDESAFAGPPDSSFYGSVTLHITRALGGAVRASSRGNTSRSPTLRANADEHFRDPTYLLINKSTYLQFCHNSFWIIFVIWRTSPSIIMLCTLIVILESK